jgi:hypothetical protein
MAVEGGPDEKVKLYASWNGATEVESWELLAGPDVGRLEPAGSVPRDGFETAKLVQTSDSLLAVRSETVLVRLGAQARRLPSARRSIVVGPGSWLGPEEAVAFSRSSAFLSRFDLEPLRDRRKSIPERAPVLTNAHGKVSSRD